MGTLVTLFAGTMREQFGMTKVIPFIAAFVGVNGVVEAIVCFVIGTAVSMALKKSTPLLGIINNIMRRNTLGDFMWKCSWKFGSKNVDF